MRLRAEGRAVVRTGRGADETLVADVVVEEVVAAARHVAQSRALTSRPHAAVENRGGGPANCLVKVGLQAPSLSARRHGPVSVQHAMSLRRAAITFVVVVVVVVVVGRLLVVQSLSKRREAVKSVTWRYRNLILLLLLLLLLLFLYLLLFLLFLLLLLLLYYCYCH